MADRKMKVGDEIWSFSTSEVKVLGPFAVEVVLNDKHLWHYHVREVGYNTMSYLRDDNAGTKGEAARFCFDYWLKCLQRKREEVDDLMEDLLNLMKEEPC